MQNRVHHSDETFSALKKTFSVQVTSCNDLTATLAIPDSMSTIYLIINSMLDGSQDINIMVPERDAASETPTPRPLCTLALLRSPTIMCPESSTIATSPSRISQRNRPPWPVNIFSMPPISPIIYQSHGTQQVQCLPQK